MIRFQNLSLKYKLVLIITFISVVSIFATTSALMVSGIETLKTIIKNELSVTTKVIGEGSIAALLFNDKEFAEESLSGFRSNSAVNFSCLYDEKGQVFTIYPQKGMHKEACPDPKKNRVFTSFIEGEYVKIFQEIKQGSRLIGYIFVISDLSKISSYKHRQIMSALLIILTATIAVAFLAFGLQKSISTPLRRLVDVTNDYKLLDFAEGGGEIHVPTLVAQTSAEGGGDEIDKLVRVFNVVLSRSEAINQELTEHKLEKERMGKEIEAEKSKYDEIQRNFNDYKKTHDGFIKNHKMTIDFLNHEAHNYQLDTEINAGALKSGLYRPLDKDYVDSLSKNVQSALNMCETISDVHGMVDLEKQLLSEEKISINLIEFVNFHIEKTLEGRPNLRVFPIEAGEVTPYINCYKAAFNRMIEEILTLFSTAASEEKNYFIKVHLGQAGEEMRLLFEFSSMKTEKYSDAKNGIVDIDNAKVKRQLYATKFFCNLNAGKMDVDLSKDSINLSISFPYKTDII
ncbi:MAG: CHASE sensor domain-containing protein [Alphaproteobacteria bacterium]